MTRVMGDSTQLAGIPLDVQIAATYANGHVGVSTRVELEARFPHQKYGQVWIDVTGDDILADVRDWETGDKGGSLEDWVIQHNAHSTRKNAVIYCNRDTIPEVRQLTGTQVLGTDYFLWIATLDGTLFGPAQYPHVIANQIKGAQLTGGDYDLSLVFDASFWLPVPVPPKPPLTDRQRAEQALAELTVYVGQH